MRGADELRRLLRRLDGRGYKAYRELRGHWFLPLPGEASAGPAHAGEVELVVDHVQADPFAAPSRLRLRLHGEVPRFDAALRGSRAARTATADFLARRLHAAAAAATAGGARRGSGRSGAIGVDAGGQTVLERSAVVLGSDTVEARLAVGLPAAGRRVLGDEAEALLLHRLPALAVAALRAATLPTREALRHARCAEDHAALVKQLPVLGLVAFLADGSLLPRESGASDRPLRGDDAVPLRAPASLAVELEAPHAGLLRGLGVPEGVTLIVGGGYHGKSTLLRAIERGVHPHVPGDGRERVASRLEAVKVRAEDGRRVAGCDIHAFVGELPHGRSTRPFWSDDASGSTSQAAAIVEALEAGATALLLDEDTSATNFLVRDARMRALVPAEHEPITPFVDRVRELHEALGVSTVLVMGGSGDYLDVADTVIEMRAFETRDVTAEARRVAAAVGVAAAQELREPLSRPAPRVPVPSSLDPRRGHHRLRVEARGVDALVFGEEVVDLRALEQLVEPSQVRAIGLALAWAGERAPSEAAAVLDDLDARLDADGLDALSPGSPRGDLARPRRFEVAAALSRLRSLRLEAAGAARAAPLGDGTARGRGDATGPERGARRL